jgi:hypothetical protein
MVLPDSFRYGGGVLKLAAASRTAGAVACCEGRWAIAANETRKRRANLERYLVILFIGRSHYPLAAAFGPQEPKRIGCRGRKGRFQCSSRIDENF